MKTLVINGSPRKEGDSMTLVKEMMKFLEGEVRIVHAYYDRISPCMDCRYCWDNQECCIDDDMQEVYRLLNEVDNVIMASPIYFSELTGQLLNLASRFQLFYSSKYLRKDPDFHIKSKKGVLVLSAGGETRSMDRAIKTANVLFKQMNVDLIGNVFTLKTNDIPGADDKEALEKARELAIRLNDLNNL